VKRRSVSDTTSSLRASTPSFGVGLPVTGAPVFQKYLFEEFEKLYGGMWDLEVDPVKHARKMIAHIDKKRKALGIDRARERTLVDMATRRELGSA
jgi:carbon-monoxide dehydrogenase catalytic subunit